MSALSVLPDLHARPTRGTWARQALTATTLALTVCAGSAVIGLTPAHAGTAPAGPSAGPTIPVGASPLGVAVSPDGSKAYVVNYGDDSVLVINS